MARKMKDSGVPWIGSIPFDWEVRKVKQYYKLQTGFTPDTKKEEYYDDINGYDWVNITDIQDGKVITETKKKISQEYIDMFSPTKIPADSLMYSFKLSVGQTAFAGKPLYSNEAIASFLPSEDVDLHFLRYSSFMIMENAEVNIYNARILNRERINNAYIVFPPLEKQRIIAAFLDAECARVDDVIEKTRESIEEYKKLKQAVITQAVTKGIRPGRAMKDSGIEWIGEIPSEWKMTKMKYVAIFQPSCDTSSMTEESEITYTPMECIKNGYFINNKALYGKVSSSLTPYSEGDIVIAKVTPCFENGNVAVMENLSSGFGLGSSELFVLRPHSIETRFLFYWLQNDLFKQHGCATMTGTGGLKRVSPYFVNNCTIVLPDKSEQIEIVCYLEEKSKEIDFLMSKKEKVIAELESYKKSLIFEYVTGKKEVPA